MRSGTGLHSTIIFTPLKICHTYLGIFILLDHIINILEHVDENILSS